MLLARWQECVTPFQRQFEGLLMRGAGPIAARQQAAGIIESRRDLRDGQAR